MELPAIGYDMNIAAYYEYSLSMRIMQRTKLGLVCEGGWRGDTSKQPKRQVSGTC